MKFAESVFDGYQHNTKVELFAQRNHRIAVAMTNNSTRSSVFLCMNSWAFGYRMLEISLPRLLPWYFPEEHLRRDGFEYKLLKLLADGEYTSFKRLLNKVGRRMLQEDD